jgi:hypothetical protein
MADAPVDENEFGKELAAAFEADEAAELPKAPDNQVDPTKADDATPPAGETPPKPGEEPKPDDSTKPKVPKEDDKNTPPADDKKKKEDGTTPPEDPKMPQPSEESKPLTKDDVTSIIQNIRTEERTSGEALNNQVKEVMDAYYPEGLSNVLVDQNTGKELRTPADVVAASGGELSTEQAAQWLMNEQFKLDQNIAKIKEDAKGIAESTLKFKQDTIDVLTRYEPLFKWQPSLQGKVWTQFSKLVKADEKKGVILSAPDMREYYDTVLEPYRLAYEYANKQSATNPTPPPAGTPGAETPPAPTPGADDRLDEGGDGGASPVDDPNDFAQQVKKELANPF